MYPEQNEKQEKAAVEGKKYNFLNTECASNI
jgi:hypothetical protein